MSQFKNEYEAISLLIEGNLSAFNFLYRLYYQSIYRNIFKFVKDEMLAEDLLQEVFMVLWEKRAQMNKDVSVGGWLFVVSYNKSINLLKNQLKETILLKDNEKLTTESHILSEIDEIQYQSKLTIIKDAVNMLPSKKRQVFKLCKFENKKPEEVAEELGLTVITVRDYLKQSTKLIKDYAQVNYVGEASVLILMILRFYL